MNTQTDGLVIEANIGVRVNPDTKEVTLFLSNQPWGPVVTGATLDEAKAKMMECINATMVVHSFCELVERNDGHKDLPEIARANAAARAIEDSKRIRERIEIGLRSRELDDRMEKCA